jgi:hypothetical protein
VLVCELAGGYDLLVTLMLAEGKIEGLFDEANVFRFYLDATTKSPPPVPS